MFSTKVTFVKCSLGTIKIVMEINWILELKCADDLEEMGEVDFIIGDNYNQENADHSDNFCMCTRQNPQNGF